MLALTPEHIAEMKAHAERSYPEECCGLMLGQLELGQNSASQKQLVELVALDNSWDPEVAENLLTEDATDVQSKRRRYWIDPRELLRVQREARNRSLSIIGVYHSHPDAAAVPSECDRALAWAEYSYSIVSVRHGRAADLQNWALDAAHQFQPEPMWISNAVAATDRMPVST